MTEVKTPTVEELQAQFTAELGKRFDQRDNDLLAKLEKMWKEEIAKALAEQSARQSGFSLPGSETATHKGQPYSIARGMSAYMQNNHALAPMEMALSKEIGERRAMTYADSEAGGFFVPAEQSADVIELLYASAVLTELGATRRENLRRAPYLLTRIQGGVTAGWGSELATIAASQQQLDQIQMNPRRLAAVTPISDLLQILDNGGAEAGLKADMATRLGLELDKAGLIGNGIPGAEPRGVFSHAVQTSTLTDPATYDELLAFRSKVRGANALKGRLGWVASNDDMLEFEQIKDKTQPPATAGDGDVNVQPLGSRSLITGEGDNTKMLGYPIKVSTQLADGQVCFGNWADLVIAVWGGFRFDMTNALGFLTGTTHLRMVVYGDIAVRHTASFCIPA